MNFKLFRFSRILIFIFTSIPLLCSQVIHTYTYLNFTYLKVLLITYYLKVLLIWISAICLDFDFAFRDLVSHHVKEINTKKMKLLLEFLLEQDKG